MENNELELRMYTAVPYQLSGIQKGIQACHAVVRYGESVKNNPEELEKYENWANRHETLIVLNGGTTNDFSGTLNELEQDLRDNGIHVVAFREPDLGDQLSAIAFLCDERVFDKKKYMDFEEYIKPHMVPFDYTNLIMKSDLPDFTLSLLMTWEVYLGGEKNAYIRERIKNMRLA